MSDRGTPVAIRVVSVDKEVAVIKLFRVASNATVSDIRKALSRQTAIPVGSVFGLDHDEIEQSILAVLRQLDGLGSTYEIIVDGKPESRQYFNNILQRSRDIELQTQMMTNLEIGEPDIETLEWLQRESPGDVFRDTLEQVIRGDGYYVDTETLAWAKHQLGNAEP
ncbi:hypothetical protein TBK1r_68950 [Stieleria magnilauensis]|uniref:Uncharacterized protein n=2 Tax=Stieleria magnilauensis TaxID=2527963 RepID=A0ABX5Y0Q9_9BACT|nr:hypothetical protein TBK1r_68950 [Planctomycetes bacterium TBK1r]